MTKQRVLRVRFLWSVGALIIGFSTLASAALAQVTGSGTIHGTVKDESGAPMPGVTVTLASPALQVGQIVAVTDSLGSYREINLPAGTYRATFELGGFTTVIREELRLTVGFVAQVDVTMVVGAIRESITVTGQGPVVNTATTTSSVNLTQELLESVPRGRGLTDVYVLTPGVTTTGAPDVGDSNLASRQGIAAFGLAATPKLLVDGINITDTGDTNSRTYLGAYAFGEMQMKTSGNDAEVSTGGISMVAEIRSGGNEFHGSSAFAFERPWLQANNITPTERAQGLSFTQPLNYYYDVAGDIGGRLIRDKLWFYLAGNRQAQGIGLVGYADGPGLDGKYLTADDTPGVFVSSLSGVTTKLSYQLSKNNKMIGVVSRHQKVQPQNSASRFVPRESTRNYLNPTWVYKGELQSTMSHMLLDVVVGDAGYFANYRSDYGKPGNPPRYDISTTLFTGSHPSWNQQRRHRYQVADSISYFPEESFLGGQHELKAGTEFYRSPEGLGKLSNPAGNYLLYYNAGVPFQIDINNNPIQPHDLAQAFAVYLKDSWRFRNGVTVNWGVRWTRQSASLPAQSVGASPEFPMLFPAATFAERNILTWTRTVPRLGVAWSLDNKTAMKATYGIYNSELVDTFADAYTLNAQIDALFKWTDPTHANDYVPGTVDLNLNGPDFISITGAANNILNPNLQQPIITEATASFERELRPNVGFDVRYVFKRQTNSFDTNGSNVLRPNSAYNIPVTRQEPGPDGRLGTPDDGGLVTFYDYDPAFKGAAFVGRERLNNPNPNHYNAIQVGVEKRASGRWSAIASFWAIKNHRWLTNTFDSPNVFFPLDETWTSAATVSGSYRLPGDLQVSGFLQSKSGVRGQRTYTFTGIPQLNNTTLPLEQYGSQKGQQLNILDLRVSKRFSLPANSHWEVQFEVFNALNSSIPTAINYASGPSFGYYTSVVPPRVGRIGLRFLF